MIAKQKSNKTKESLFSSLATHQHEQVIFCHDEATGLKAIIAIHNTTLGPAMGGVRFWNYSTELAAVNDVLRLSRGMTYKNAIAGLNAGGGKAVIIGEPAKLKNEVLMRRFGKFIHTLNGNYYTAEDMNMSTTDMEYISMETPFVTGLPEYMGGAGDPSPYTAYGVYMGIKASAKRAYGSDSLGGKKILVQGVGSVGSELVALLDREGANISVADLSDARLKFISQQHNVEVIDTDKVFLTPVDIYSPCAMGATINDRSIELLECDIICGGANNQLQDDTIHDQALVSKGILYAPDFLVNSGGITNVYYDYVGNHNRDRVMAQVEKIYETTLKVFTNCDDDMDSPQLAAMKMADRRIKEIGNLRLTN